MYFSRTLTWVYDAILDDLVFPAEIVGKRIRVKLDGKQVMKVHLDKTQQTNIEHKVSFFTSINDYSTIAINSRGTLLVQQGFNIT